MTGRRARQGDGGMVTAEVAVVLPVFLMVVVLACWPLSAAVATFRCGDAARELARALARGDDQQQAQARALSGAPADARARVHRKGQEVRVDIEAAVHPLGPWMRLLPGIPVSASVTTSVES